jgi:hypothetical protein
VFRSRKHRAETAVADQPQDVEAMFAEIDELTRRNREHRDPELERRILSLRHRSGAELTDPDAEQPPIAEPDFGALPAAGNSGLPIVEPGQITPELLRAGILTHGCLHVRGVVAEQEASQLIEEMDRTFAGREAFLAGSPTGDGYYEEFQPQPPYDLNAERAWVTGGGGIWLADSPRVTFSVLDALERAGLQAVISDYLGERPAISVNKCTLRRVSPDTGTGWHQDGAFLGDNVRAMNVWMALNRCGDVAPGMDVVPRRLDGFVPTGTEGATFEWSVSRSEAERAAGEAGVLRPVFEAGDVLLFDEMFLHSTATDPSMKQTRYAVESWFFGPSGFPSEYVPLAI